jgi:hypothetical protein
MHMLPLLPADFDTLAAALKLTSFNVRYKW